MIKSELVHTLNEKLPELQLKDVELALNCILEQMVEALGRGERIETGILVVLIVGIGHPELRVTLKQV